MQRAYEIDVKNKSFWREIEERRSRGRKSIKENLAN